jgi:hypothetical protein
MDYKALPRRLQDALATLAVSLALLEREVTPPRNPGPATRRPVVERRRRTNNLLVRRPRVLIA